MFELGLMDDTLAAGDELAVMEGVTSAHVHFLRVHPTIRRERSFGTTKALLICHQTATLAIRSSHSLAHKRTPIGQ